MSVKIETIYIKTKEKYKLKLIAGEAGTSNVISWIYIMEDLTTADFIRGSELIITTGLGIKDDMDFYRMIQVLIEQKAAGMIVNTGNYINTIPPSVINLCNECGFPLFVMPWEIHLVDVTQEYCNWIIRDRQKQQNISECFYNILFREEKADVSLAKRFDYEIEGQYNIIILCIPETLAGEENEDIYKYFETEVFSKLAKTLNRYCYVINENKLIVIIQLIEEDENVFVENLERVYRSIVKLQNGNIAVGSVQRNIGNLRKAYKHALATYEMIGHNQGDTQFYENLGVNKVLMEIEDREVLVKMIKEYLGKIQEHDRQHKSQYMDTLELYLKYNGSVQLVAEKSFTHRNTINYRVKKIKELLETDLEDTKEKFMLQLCFYMKYMLDKTDNKK